MREKEQFRIIGRKKIKFSLNMRMTAYVGAMVLVSFVAGLFLVKLIQWAFPVTKAVPEVIQFNLFSIFVALVTTFFISKLFFGPIKELRSGMKRVADGDFTTKIERKSSSVEMQEVFAGFNMMIQELDSTQILQTDFVSNVSHEFKTPINAIEGYTTLLQDNDNLDENQQQYVEKILYNTKRLSSLVSNILLMSKFDNLSITSNKQEYCLDEQIRESIVALESSWLAKNIEFDVDLDRINYCGDEAMMHHVWDNLIGNAIKFSPNGGEIRLRLYKKDGEVIFTVEDKGPGMSEEAIRHAFDKFYQGDTSHKDEGNGLGLALVKRILQISDGKVSAENIQGGGCRFTVTL